MARSHAGLSHHAFEKRRQRTDQKCFATLEDIPIHIPTDGQLPRFDPNKLKIDFENLTLDREDMSPSAGDEQENEEVLAELDVLHGHQKKKKSKKAVPLPCSYNQFVDLLEELLIFHAWYKTGSPFSTSSSNREMNVVSRKIRKLLIRLKTCVPRTEGHGWKLQKFHELLHVVKAMHLWGHSENWDAGHGERFLKYWAKWLSATCQRIGRDAYTVQVSKRAHEVCFMGKARHALRPQYEKKPETEAGTDSTSFFEGHHSYTITKEGDDYVTSEWKGRRKETIVNPVVMSFFRSNLGTQSIINRKIDCHTDLSREGTNYRAHPNYTNSGSGAWYEHAMVEFENDAGTEKDMFPSKLLCFFNAQTVENGPSHRYALVHPCTYQHLQGCKRKRMADKHSLKIMERWVYETERKYGINVPKLYMVRIESIGTRLHVVEENPGLVESSDSPKYVWVYSDRRTEWGKHF